MGASTAGRKVVPIGIKQAKGTYRKDRDKKAAPPSEEKPVAPSWLNERAKEIFDELTKRLEEQSRASATYTESQALLASRLEEVERFDKMLNEDKDNGYLYKSVNSYGDDVLKEHPAVKLREKAFRHAQSLLDSFGLLPVSSGKVGGAKDNPPSNPFEQF